MKNYCKLTCRGVTLFWSSRKWYMAILRIIFLVTSIVLILIYLIGPIAFLLNPDKRRSYLISAAPALSQTKTEQLSPLAKKLKYHVEVLAEKIGERAYGQKSQGQARDYIKNQFQKFGYSVKLMKFEIKGLPKVFGESSFYNIEIILGSQASLNRESGIWVIGAHYDTAVGTPGADDNASGVAVLI
ncbi:MAG: M28 family peptidase, partial [Elusimicrobiota bacterium]|nr:M28 family peptidase [Elusimicrobiota bacterium]